MFYCWVLCLLRHYNRHSFEWLVRDLTRWHGVVYGHKQKQRSSISGEETDSSGSLPRKNRSTSCPFSWTYRSSRCSSTYLSMQLMDEICRYYLCHDHIGGWKDGLIGCLIVTLCMIVGQPSGDCRNWKEIALSYILFVFVYWSSVGC